MGGGGGGGAVGKCVTKENPKSDLDLDSGFVNNFSLTELLLTRVELGIGMALDSKIVSEILD